MANKPTELSWESDEDLLGDGVSTVIKHVEGTDEIDEDALLDSDGEENQRKKGEIVETVDLGLNGTDVAFDDTANSQELDYDDILEDVQPEESDDVAVDGQEDEEDPLIIDNRRNKATCIAQPIDHVEENDDDSDENGKRKDRDRFQTERKTISLAATNFSKSSGIPENLEVTKEMQDEIESFEKKKNSGKRNPQGGILNRRGQNRLQHQQKQSFGSSFRRGSPSQRGSHQHLPTVRFNGPRNVNPVMPMSRNQNFGVLRGPPPFHSTQRFNQQPVSTVIPQQMIPHQNPHHFHKHPEQFPPPCIDQLHIPYQALDQPQYCEQHQLPFSRLQTIQQSNSQPLQQFGSAIHLNPKFHGPVHQAQPMPLLSVPQHVYNQHQLGQQFQEQSHSWSPSSVPVMLNYVRSSKPRQMLAQNDRPGLLESPPIRFTAQVQQFQDQQQQMNPVHQGSPFQNQPLIPEEAHFLSDPLQEQEPLQMSVAGLQPKPNQKLFSSINLRSPRSAYPVRGNSNPKDSVQNNSSFQRGQMRPLIPKTHRSTVQNMSSMGMEAGSVGWNPPPSVLVPQLKPVDPEKLKKQNELEEKKRARAERFKMNTPVSIKEGSTDKKKMITITRSAHKRPSGDSSLEQSSPPKVIKLEPGGAAVSVEPKTDKSSLTSSQIKVKVPENIDLEKALEEQKRKREQITRAKEAKRKQDAERRKLSLGKKLVQQAKVTSTASTKDQGVNLQQHDVRNQSQSHQFQPAQAQQQHNQSTSNQSQRKTHIGLFSNKHQFGQTAKGHSEINQGQPIRVLGQGNQSMSQGPIVQGYGKNRAQGQNKGRDRMQKFQNVVQLQQVELQNLDIAAAGESQLLRKTPMSSNRTVLPVSSAERNVDPGLNSSNATYQDVKDRIVLEKDDSRDTSRRIVIDSKMSSTVLIKNVPKSVNISKIIARCSQFGETKLFNYKADDKMIVVQFSKPSEAAAFLNRSYRFMIDMNYYMAVSVPDDVV